MCSVCMCEFRASASRAHYGDLLMILVGSVLWNASVTLIKNKDVHYILQLSVRASRSNENNVYREGSECESTSTMELG